MQNMHTTETLPTHLRRLGGLTVSLRLRLLLSALLLMLACAIALFALNARDEAIDRLVQQQVDHTLKVLNTARTAKDALVELRRSMVTVATRQAGRDPTEAEAALREVTLRQQAIVQAAADRLQTIDASTALTVSEASAALAAAAQQGMAALLLRDTEASGEHFRRFPQLGAAADTSLDALAARAQSAQEVGLAQSNAQRQRLQGWSRSLHMAILLLSLSTSLVVLLAIFRPLQKLYMALGQITTGTALSAPPVAGNDEFGQLGTALYDLSQLTAQLNVIAYQDALTGLPNRARFEHDVTRLVQAQAPFALVFADIDHFRTINDGYGHAFGDQVLQRVAERMQWLLKGDSRLYRYSGDLFAICVPSGRDFAVERFRTLIAAEAERLRLRMAEQLTVENRSLPLCMSLGVALHPEDGRNAANLLSAADAAIYEAKRLGRNSVQFARSDYSTKARRRLELADELRQALASGALLPYFQPIVDLGSGRIVCAEALARWKHPTRGFVPPDEFIGIAEDSGQIDALTEQLLRQACASAVLWAPQRGGDQQPRLAFNLSARQVRQGVVEMISRALAETGLPAERLEIEITESAIIERPDTAERLLRELKALGASVALDDFGTGYSSLSYLLRFPIDKIKVDRSFVSQLNGQRQAGKIVAATISLAANLEITLVAEGVETVGQMATLYELGCRQQQGWLFAKALPADEFSRWAQTAPLRLDAIVRAQAEAANEVVSAA